MWRILFFLLPLVAVIWGCFNMSGVRVRERRMALVSVLVAGSILCWIQNQLVYTGYYPSPLIRCLRDVMAVCIMPLFHILFCYSMGITSELKFLRLNIGLAVLIIPELLITMSMPVGPEGLSLDTQYCYFYYQVTPTEGYKVSPFVIIFLIQTIIELQRATVLYRIFKNRNLFLSREGRLLVVAAFVMGIWVILSLLPTYEWLAVDHHMDVCLGVYSVLATLLFVLLVRVFNSSIVVDSQQKPVELGGNEDLALVDAIRVAIDRDKVYRNSSLRIEELASMVSSNRTYVARVCKLYFNMTFTELINRHRVEYAKELLSAEGPVRMESVALESGFSSASFFARVFKNHEGMTPSQWRTMKLTGVQPVVEQKPSQFHDGMTTEEALGNTPHPGEN